jgi:hypothetical protein
MADEMKRDQKEADDDFAKSLELAYDSIRRRIATGGKRGFMDEPK